MEGYKEPEIEKVNCLVCDKELDYELTPTHQGGVSGGGFMLVSFHYGSRHDQCLGYPGRKANRENASSMHKLLTCDDLEAFICDDCFEKKFDKMKGYDIEVRTRRHRTKVI